jgi:hypothetical protein
MSATALEEDLGALWTVAATCRAGADPSPGGEGWGGDGGKRTACGCCGVKGDTFRWG